MKLILEILLFTVLISCKYARAQDSLYQYQGPAFFQPLEGATEDFKYFIKENEIKPEGLYICTYSSRSNENGDHQLFKLRAYFKDGFPDGLFEMVYYEVRFQVEQFNFESIHSKTDGKKIKVSGHYARGTPNGEWHFETAKIGIPNQSELLVWNSKERQWSFILDPISFQGNQNSEGYMEGIWTWDFGGQYHLNLSYQSGIMTAFNLNDQPQFESLFTKENKFLPTADSIIKASQEERWIWNPGQPSFAPIIEAQTPISNVLTKAFEPFLLFKFLVIHPEVFPFPSPPTTGRIYFPILTPVQNGLYRSVEEIAKRDSMLQNIMERPVFQLRRATNPVCDSLLTVGEVNLQKSYALRAKIETFLNDSSRVLSPTFFETNDSISYTSHDEVAKDLVFRENQLEEEFHFLIQALNEKQEILRLRGTMEELEEEWLALVEELQLRIKPESTDRTGSRLFAFLVEQHFDSYKGEYNRVLSLQERKELLLEIVSYFRYYHAFFEEKAYKKLESTPEEMIESYTQFWYNPYMGTHNVEVLVKKKLVSKVNDYFWPFVIEKMYHVENGHEFLERYNTLLKLKSFLLDFADHKGKEAKKLERQIVRAKDLSTIEPLIEAYLSDR